MSQVVVVVRRVTAPPGGGALACAPSSPSSPLTIQQTPTTATVHPPTHHHCHHCPVTTATTVHCPPSLPRGPCLPCWPIKQTPHQSINNLATTESDQTEPDFLVCLAVCLLKHPHIILHPRVHARPDSYLSRPTPCPLSASHSNLLLSCLDSSVTLRLSGALTCRRCAHPLGDPGSLSLSLFFFFPN